MLGKLLKYEFRATGRVFLPMYALLLVMSFFARLIYGAQMTQAQGTLLTILTVVVTIAVIGLLVAVAVVTLLLICRRFWNNLLGREGYLMNVLPVTSAAHVWAKLIAAAVWTVASTLCCAAALFIMLSRFSEAGGFREFTETLRAFREVLREHGVAGQADLLLAQVIAFILLSLLSYVLKIYAAMSIGQLANKHRIWASVGAYFGIGILQSILFSRVFMLRIAHYSGAKLGGGMQLEMSGEGFKVFEDIRTALPAINGELLWVLLLNLVFCAALFIVTERLLNKRLNLQ